MNWIWKQPYLLLLVAPLAWGGNAVLARGVADLIPPLTLSFWRWTLAFLILLPFTWKHAKRDWPVALQSWKILSVLAFLGVTSFNSLLYMAAHTISAMNITILQCAMPAYIVLGSFLFFKEKISKIQVIGMALCIAGALAIVTRVDFGVLQQLTFAAGDLLMVVANVFYGLYSVLLRKRPPMHPLSFLTYTFGIGVVGVLPFYLWELSISAPLVLNTPILSSVLYVAVFPSIVAYLCWNRGVEAIGANISGLYINLVPVFAAVMSILFLGEGLELFHIFGMALIFGGILVFNRRPS